MLGGYWEQRRHSRWWIRWRLLLLSPRRRRVAGLIVTICVLLLVGVLALWRRFLARRQRLDWSVRPLPPEQAELFAERVWLETQRFGDAARGVVLPLFDEIALLGFSLILELRRLQVPLPIEVPHCGDLDVALQAQMSAQDPLVRFYDVCELAASAAMDGAAGEESPRKLFCVDLAHCHAKFRGFDIKVLAVVYSRFQELMLLDADTLFFQSPATLWDTDKYRNTGTLFFNDRISYESSYLAARLSPEEHPNVGALHDFLATFDVAPYRHLSAVEGGEPRAEVPNNLAGIEFGFKPSAFLLRSHVWKLRSGHQMDSSLVLWSKTRQPRATAILASFVSLNSQPTAPSYGDKELYWLACELAETAYAFSDFAVSAVGWELLVSGDSSNGVLCGDALQHFPVQPNSAKGPGADVEPLYMNSDNILEWGRATRRLYRTAARPADLYPGSFTERKLLQTCPFDVTTMALGPFETLLLTQRRQFYDVVAGWEEQDQTSWWHPFA